MFLMIHHTSVYRNLSISLAEIYPVLKIRLVLITSIIMFMWVLLFIVLECLLIKVSVRILLMMFADKEQQEARARDMILREEVLENHEPFLHLMPMLNWSCQYRYINC